MNRKTSLFISLLFCVSLGLGVWGVFLRLDSSIAFWPRFLESLHLSLQLFTISYPDFLFHNGPNSQGIADISWQLQTARFIAPLVTITTLIKVFAQRLDRTMKRFRIQLFYRRHNVIFGFSLMAKLTCEDLINSGLKQIIVVDPDLDEEDQKWLIDRGIISVKSSSSESFIAGFCKTDKARYIFALDDDDSENMKVLVRSYQYNRSSFSKESSKEKRRNTTKFYIHFAEHTYRQLKFGQQFSDLSDYFEVKIVSVFDLAGKQLAKDIYKKYALQIQKGKKLDICVFGFSQSGQSIVEQLIRLSYFNRKQQFQITVFDEDPRTWKRFVERFPIADNSLEFYAHDDQERLQILKDKICFPEIRFKDISFESAALISGEVLQSENESDVMRIGILTLTEASRNLAIADSLLQQKRSQFTEVFVRSDEPKSEIRHHIRKRIQEEDSLSLVPTLDEICKLEHLKEDLTEKLAMAIHSEYLREQNVTDENSQWPNLPENFKESNRQAALHTEIKCCLLGIYVLDLRAYQSLKETARSLREVLNDPDKQEQLELLAECEHNRWTVEKLLDNWIPGLVRDNHRKRHPNLVPWDLDNPSESDPFFGYSPLNEADKQKDRNTIEKIPLLLEMVEQ